MKAQAESPGKVKQAVPFFWVNNIERSVQYYQALGFEISNKWIQEDKLRWCWLQIDAAAIMLQEFWKEGQHANLSKDALGEGVAVCFMCEDALAVYHAALLKQIAVQEPFVGNGMWVTAFTDPDNYKIFFESVTDVAEETKYSAWNK
jgi:lactoylglutathione lyase